MRRRMLASFGGAPLPYDAEVEYLNSTGSQFIDTGITLTNEYAISVKFLCNRNESFVGVCGTRSWANSKNISIGVNYNEKRCVIDFNNSDYNLFRCSIPTTVPGDVIIATSSSEKRYGTANNGDEYGNYEICQDVFATSNTAKIFRADGISVSSDIHVFSASISRNGIMLLDFKPVRFTNENGVSEGAMYDRLGVGGMNPDGSLRNDGLYRNRGTGAFGWKEMDGTIVQPQ